MIEWRSCEAIPAPICPVCGAEGAKRADLTIIGGPTLIRCPCGTRFWNDLTTFNYAESPEDQNGIRYYIEQGAAIDALIEPIARLAPARIRRCLEIGCGFGFSLDAAQVLFGWSVVGVDPSPLARAGKQTLGVDIRAIYADATTDFGAPFDLVYGSEVIEHVPAPHDFLKICRAHLAPGGILILTTPDADAIAPDLAEPLMLPILSPGLHLVLFNADSLALAARMAEFRHVLVVRRPHALILYASDAALEIDAEGKLDRGDYRRYLESVLARPALPSIVEGGMLYRLFKERVNDAVAGEAERLFDVIAKACEARFGFKLAPPFSEAVLARVADADFCAPFFLPGLAFHRGILQLNGGAAPNAAAPWFDAALLAARAFRQGYAKVLMDDGETGDVERLAPIHAIMALAQSEPAAAIARLRNRAMAALDPGLAGALFSRLADLGLLEEAASLESFLPQDAASALDIRRGKIALLHRRDPIEAARLFRRACAGAGAGLELWDIKYHEMLAWIIAENAMSAAAAAREIIAAGEAVPENLRRSVDRLLAEHPAVARALTPPDRLGLRGAMGILWRRLMGLMR